MDNHNFIDYEKLVDRAMHNVIREILKHLTDYGFVGDQHFFISFLTNYPGVLLSPRLKQRYPTEMTIILQYQFEKLVLTESGFSVVLSFDNIKEKIVIPFEALVAFADPSEPFGLEFKHASTDIYMLNDSNNASGKKDIVSSSISLFSPMEPNLENNEKKGAISTEDTTSDSAITLPEKKTGNVVSLEAYRKKEKKG